LNKKKDVIIIGAGPAGLTAAYELSKNPENNIFVLEASDQIGGISKTVNYKGNLIDIGGHRFFSKSEKVLNWWLEFLDIIDTSIHNEITYHNQSVNLDSIIQKKSEDAMLVRSRKSRIYFNKRFFDYPLQLNLGLIKNLGKKRTLRITRDLVKAKLKPIKPENTLEEFYLNRFGKELYLTFFKDYTKKVWGKE
jgi:protoporphyrinogen oxidase